MSDRTLSPQNERQLVLFLFLGLTLAFSAGTQYVAWRLGFSAALGRPLFVPNAHTLALFRASAVLCTGSWLAGSLLGQPRWLRSGLFLSAITLASLSLGPFHAPHMIVVWYSKSGQVAADTAAVFRAGLLVLGSTAVSVTAAIGHAWSGRSQAVPSTSHGSAAWGTGDDLAQERGLILGRRPNHLLRFEGEGHVLTVAPTRSGKGVSCVIPNLLDHPGSILVTDPKGENFAVTARWRRDIGQQVHAFDPFRLAGGDATYNPLDLIDPESAEAVDEARMLADMIVLSEGHGGEQLFWNEEARAVLTGLILHVAANAAPELRTLSHVRTLLTLPPESFAELLKDMRESAAVSGLVSRSAARILQKAERERSGVISTAQSHTHFLDSARMARVLGRSTVDLSILKREPTSVYLILPSDRLEAYARWLRIMIACSLLAIARSRGQPKERVLFLLDEFAHLGKMHPVQRDIGLAGGFGVTFWLIVQDLSQLRSTYGDTWPTFLANADVLQAFGTNDWDTAEYLSKMTGEATIFVRTQNQSRGLSRGKQSQRQEGTALSVSERNRRLLLPDEVRRLARDTELLFVKGGSPLLTLRTNYREDAEFLGRSDPNPLYQPVTVPQIAV
ncbi:MAG TPA: type IV secretory system conjugative DNA transfer family protein [Gemmatimonadaceae bacterium]|nr:type IV secretory system conjugative DNA transfer family protein [Gemmatimonadaceae bacterium]